MKLNGMDEGHIQEAAAASDLVVGFSTYLHGIGYDPGKFKEELAGAVEHIKRQAGG